ncbi:MAG: PEP-CTERM sorting domain-containing protein [Sulfuriferula multivorans]|uniref:PEP-CTERM sorting domain-containing protein n=1 Tax=Sulfuriferula multivorans TaxID=1559896 RepID=A0A7C9P5N8_9PROT|nr:PEP-CTERM sorting domain-containing protein [Sulfuriferula multivorans]
MFLLRKAFLVLGLLSIASVAVASPIVLNGDHFTVTYESTQTGLYKQGFMAGSLDTVYFQPNTFTALSSGNQVSTQGLLNLTFTINSGYTFAGLSFTERGNYFLRNGGAVNVVASVQQENSASTLLNLQPGSPLASIGRSTPWELTGAVSLQNLGASQSLTISLDNTLFASSSGPGLGFIQTTYAGFQVMTRPAVPPASVPEPSSVALVLIGMVAAVLIGRRRVRIPLHGARL